MKQLLRVYKNWRCDVFLLLFCAAMLLMFCEADNLTALFISKAVALGIGYVAYRLFKYWDAKGLIDELTDNDL